MSSWSFMDPPAWLSEASWGPLTSTQTRSDGCCKRNWFFIGIMQRGGGAQLSLSLSHSCLDSRILTRILKNVKGKWSFTRTQERTFPIQCLEEVVSVGVCAPRRFWFWFWFCCTGALWSLLRLRRLGIIKGGGAWLTRQLRFTCSEWGLI